MYPVSPRFLAALAESHSPVSYIEVWSSYNGDKILDALPFVTAQVSLDSSADQRRSFTVNFSDATGEYVPQFPSDVLMPYGQELRPYRGIQFPDGTVEVVPLGCFPLVDTGLSYTGKDLPVVLTAPDRVQLVQAAKSTDFISIDPGTNVAVAAQALINSVVPGLSYSFEPTTFVTPGVVLQPGDDPWKAAADLMASAGQVLAFDALGVVTSQTTPDPDTALIAATYPDGILTTMTQVDKKITVTDTYNVVVVSGEGPGVTVPVVAIAQDTNPQSPTFVDGPLGSRVKVIKSDQATTTDQAQAIANSELRKALGLTEQVGFTGIVNPATDAYDVIAIEKDKLYVNGRYVVDQVTIPLVWNDLMKVTTRARVSS